MASQENLPAALAAAETALALAEDAVYNCSRACNHDTKDPRHIAASAQARQARAARDAALRPASALATSIVSSLLSHHAFECLPTVAAALATALLETSFSNVAQELGDAAAPGRLIVDFRREWRRIHCIPDRPHGFPNYALAYSMLAFGSAIAVLVANHVDDAALMHFVTGWRMQYNVQVSERDTPVNSFSLLLPN